MELQRSGASYTALTLEQLHRAGWKATQIFFIIGADAFAEIATWYAYPAILDACHFAVIARPGMTLEAALSSAPDVASRVEPAPRGLASHTRTAVFPIQARTSEVSSSDIRARLAAGRSIDTLVPPAVARHIYAHGLYLGPAEAGAYDRDGRL
jgi:nicotinate-nucleotide adenylyltransferase